MDGYKVKADIEPNDNYQNALKDFIQANNSFQKLTPQQKKGPRFLRSSRVAKNVN